MALTREEEFSRVRELLDHPMEQRPAPHLIFSHLIRAEQWQANKINATGRPWAEASLTITSVANQAEYTISAADFGKPFLVYRALSENVIVPVPFADYVNELKNQRYDFFDVPTESGITRHDTGEKLAFFRETPVLDPDTGISSGAKKVRIYPIPEEAGRVYTVHYATGRRDWSDFTVGDEPILPEWTDWRTHRAAAHLIAYAEWDGLSPRDNREKRLEMREYLGVAFGEQNDEFLRWIRNPQTETISTIDDWFE